MPMSDQEAVVALAKVFGWKQDGDPHGFRFHRDGGTIGNFIPDHEAGDAGVVVDKMNGLGFTTFHYEPAPDGRWKAYFSNPEWVMVAGPNWKHALVRAALNAVARKKDEAKTTAAQQG